ncbi:sulfatase-like hydrolase/transferase [Xenorhabdus sp. 42]|nr:sulfatase-like hydrolase/transferase [Xenorhabdus sp. 42]
MIIGESTSRNHMGLYGYRYNTTPNLQKIKNSNLHIFTDVISPNASTIPSLKKIFTFFNSENEKNKMV